MQIHIWQQLVVLTEFTHLDRANFIPTISIQIPLSTLTWFWHTHTLVLITVIHRYNMTRLFSTTSTLVIYFQINRINYNQIKTDNWLCLTVWLCKCVVYTSSSILFSDQSGLLELDKNRQLTFPNSLTLCMCCLRMTLYQWLQCWTSQTDSNLLYDNALYCI